MVSNKIALKIFHISMCSLQNFVSRSFCHASRVICSFSPKINIPFFDRHSRSATEPLDLFSRLITQRPALLDLASYEVAVSKTSEPREGTHSSSKSVNEVDPRSCFVPRVHSRLPAVASVPQAALQNASCWVCRTAPNRR